MTTIAEIEKAALSLSEHQRGQLLEALLKSLPPLGDELTDAQEVEEILLRDQEIESGAVQALREEEFWQRINAGRRR